jgi:hypothetical protein
VCPDLGGDRRSRRLDGLEPRKGTSKTQPSRDTYTGSIKRRVLEIEKESCRTCGHVGRTVLSDWATAGGSGHVVSTCLNCGMLELWESSGAIAGTLANSVASYRGVLASIIGGQNTFSDYSKQMTSNGMLPATSATYTDVLRHISLKLPQVLNNGIAKGRAIVKDRPPEQVGSWVKLVFTMDGFYTVHTKGNGAAGKSPECVVVAIEALQVSPHHHARSAMALCAFEIASARHDVRSLSTC